MKLLILKAKVLLTSEEQMELQASHDFGSFKDEDKRWVYRKTAVICSEVYRVVQYNKTKTLVEMWSEANYLVDEPFDEVIRKWEECKPEDEDYDGQEQINSDKEEEDEE